MGNNSFIYLSISAAVILLLLLIILVVLFLKNNKTRKLLKDQMTFFSVIYNSIPDMAYSKDLNRKYTTSNKKFAAFFGKTPPEIIGKTFGDLYNLDPEQVKRIDDADIAVMSKNAIKKTEEWVVFPDKSRRLFENIKVPLVSNGKVIGLLGLDRDITEHKDAVHAANEASRAKSNFLARMSHEIRTPMNAIIGMTELALRENEIDSVYKHIRTVKQAGAHLLSIINDVLDFSKIEIGKLEIFSSEYLLSSLINDVISIIRMRALDSQVRFAVNVDSNIPNALYGDVIRIRQVLLNILNNAVKFTEKGFVSFALTKEIIDDNTINLVFTIADSGRGIKPEDVEHLFDEYVQIDQEKNRWMEGAGLGLAISWNIVKAMNGDIKVSSEYGKGSVFTVTFPQKISSPEPLASVKNKDELNVLVYERREIYAFSIAKSLNSLGVRCTLALDNHGLLKEIAANSYNFLFTSFALYERNKKRILRDCKNAKIVVFAEFGEAIPEKKLNVLSMPVYSVSIANILNGISENFKFSETGEDILRFTAPDVMVLVVDDINTNLKVAEGLLLPYKMRLDFCRSGKEAIEAVLVNHYDIIFMDHKMPGMDGIETVAHIRKMAETDPYFNNVPIIALTANAVSGTREIFLESGFNDYLSKPIDTVKLNTILERWIPKKKQKETPENESEILGNERMSEIRKFDIEGLDVNKGIFLSGGTMERYLETLGIYRKDGFEKIRDITSCLETGNIAMYTNNVHALKSASANIGALELSKTARALEAAGEINEMSYIQSFTPVLLNKLQTLLGAIGDLLVFFERGGKEEHYNLELLISELTALMGALETLDARTINLSIEALQKMPLEAGIEEKIHDIADSVLIGEYEEAGEAVKSLLNELEGQKS